MYVCVCLHLPKDYDDVNGDNRTDMYLLEHSPIYENVDIENVRSDVITVPRANIEERSMYH